MNDEQLIADLKTLPWVDGKPPRRCKKCGSDKWIHLESSKDLLRRNPDTGVEERTHIPARYGCAKCGGEFFVGSALEWKRVKEPNKCPHCTSRQVIVAVETSHGLVVACKHCNNMSLFEYPGSEGKLTPEVVKAVGKLTNEAQEFFGQLGFQFEVKKAKVHHLKNNSG